MSTDYIQLDLFPAIVDQQAFGDQPEQVFDKTRIFVTNNEVRVYQDAYGGPKVIIDGPLYDFSGNNKIGYTVEIDQGPTLLVNRSRGCGCGSLLRGINPFPGVPYQSS